MILFNTIYTFSGLLIYRLYNYLWRSTATQKHYKKSENAISDVVHSHGLKILFISGDFQIFV